MIPEYPLINPTTKALVSSFIKSQAASIGLVGPKGAGKMQIAEFVCREILGMDGTELEVKVEVVDSAEQGGIDEIRDLKKRLSIKTVGTKKSYGRAVIFKDFHMMSIPAQNSILKLLEEPPLDTLILVLAESKASMLPTIVSRLQWVSVLPLDKENLSRHYNAYDDAQIKQAYLLSGGYAAKFEKILKDQDSGLKQAVMDVKKILKLKKYERISSLENILNSQAYTQEDFLSVLQKIYLTLVHKEINKNSQIPLKILNGLDRVSKTKESLKYNPNPKLIFTDLFYKI